MEKNKYKNKYLVVVVGPTAVGKTDLCLQLATQLPAEIISADARQYYQGMPIGTAQPTQAQQAAISHHFIGFLPIDASYNAGMFAQEALTLLRKLFQKDTYAMLVGGSGLYIKALCEGLADLPAVPSKIRETLNKIALESNGLAQLQQELASVDPIYYQLVDLQNKQRVIRALEVYRATGQPYSQIRQNLPTEKRFFKIIKIGLMLDRQLLYQRIEARVEEMMKAGLLEEATALYAFRSYNSLQTIGYQEIFGYLEQKYSLDEAVRLIKRNTRRYAKRQMTWFSRQADITWFHPTDEAGILSYIRMLSKPSPWPQ